MFISFMGVLAFGTLKTFAVEFQRSTRKLADNAPVLNLRCLGEHCDKISGGDLAFQPPLQDGVHYKLLHRDRHVIPNTFEFMKKNGSEFISLQLMKGKSWLDLSHAGNKSGELLYVRDIKSTSTFQPIATVIKGRRSCPKIPILPHAGKALTKYISTILSYCGVTLVPRTPMITILWSQPPLLLIDGSDQTLDKAGAAIDAFMTQHSVLEIAWEPIHPNEPMWWVIVPRQKGMPGHLFALLDNLQWKHPDVVSDSAENKKCFKSNNKEFCIPGCPKTLLKTVTASGYNADTEHLWGKLRQGFYDAIPFQAAPVRLGVRATPPIWDFTLGWSYTFQGCASNFLDCFFLDHSPCPKINIDMERPPHPALVDKARFREVRIQDDQPLWYRRAVGYGVDEPHYSIGSLREVPANQVFYSYLFRPNYRVRKEIHQRVEQFQLERDSCSIMHVRRGDSVMHRRQGRAYLTIEAYVRAGRPLMDALGVNTILLFTDSSGAIDEAKRCEKEYPDVCKGITFRYIDKKRWLGAEGGWENPFPSGNSTEEFLIIQKEFALAQKCSMAIVGQSGYGEMLLRHMCCGFPSQPRGSVPGRCICPPKIELMQKDFNCHTGNKLLCDDKDVGGNIMKRLDDPTNMLGANYSFTRDAFRDNPEVRFIVPGEGDVVYKLKESNARESSRRIASQIQKALQVVCKHRNQENQILACTKLKG